MSNAHKSSINMNFAHIFFWGYMKDRFKQIRKALNLSQTEMGELLGKGLRAIQHYEKGERSIDNTVIILLEKAYNVNPVWLRTGTGSMFLSDNEKKADSGIVSTASSYNVPERLLILLSKLKKEDLIRVEGYIQAIVDSYKNKDMQRLSS